MLPSGDSQTAVNPSTLSSTNGGALHQPESSSAHAVGDDTKSANNESLGEMYLCGSTPTEVELNSDSSRASPSSVGNMTECVQRSASLIYTEFESLIKTYGPSVVARLMPMVVTLLENLDELYKDRAAYQAEVDHLREQCSFTISELDREKERRKQSELRLLQTEDTFDEERKSFEAKIEMLNTASRQAELRYQNAKDQIGRLELKESDWKKENTRLHDRINELIRSNVELTNQLKYASRQKPIAGSVSVIRLGSSVLPSGVPVSDYVPDNQLNSPVGNVYDTTSGGGFGFDELSSSDDAPCLDDELPDEPSPTPTYEGDLKGFAGMRREIDILIKENMDLVETKNALNIVKDDLLAKIDTLSMQNASLNESVNILTQVRTNLQAELASTDHLLSDARSEIDSLKDRVAELSRKLEEEGGSTHRKRFTRAEMSRVLSERNQFKERLIELEEAVRLMDALRAGQKGHPELLEALNPTSRFRSGGVLPASSSHGSNSAARPLQTIQNLFSAFASGSRFETDALKCQDPPWRRKASSISHSWISLSLKRTKPPVHGWCTGLRSSSFGESTCDTGRQHHLDGIPVPIQSQPIELEPGKKQLEIVHALVIPSATGRNSQSHILLITRGQPDVTSPSRTGRTYVCRILMFTMLDFNRNLCNYEFEKGFIPITATYLHGSFSSEKEDLGVPSEDYFAQIDWNVLKPVEETDSATGSLVVCSNEGRFLVIRLTSDHTEEVVNVEVVARFSFVGDCKFTNCLVSVDQTCCVTIASESSRLITLMPFRHLRQPGQYSSTHHGVTFPGTFDSASPMFVAMDRLNLDGVLLWLGNAGSTRLHCFCMRTEAFVKSCSLPPECPCLHAVAIQEPRDPLSGSLLWVSVSGSPLIASGRGVARLLAYATNQSEATLCCQIDLTAVLCAMIDTEGVTDPIDLTICRLLLVPQSRSHRLWFATRCGLIGRFHAELFANSGVKSTAVEIPSSQSVAISSYGFRRPVGNFLALTGSSNETIVLVCGHDFVDLHPRELADNASSNKSPVKLADKSESLSASVNNSGAHVIAWRLAEADGVGPN